ncbi:PREDICTED: uncharacterized protein LOC106745343 isoform X2 [Dinoponera quadriceps]|nr:PREDICTED: uncharacterized protein LOC106745343 isoform X2 [Dinoponera quadriceps]XP_014476353.1 PREDICTED: uncharacterized protein LOC106745343 isoform X2 [Dinoponera quadriceps]XP_014476354.1 PREDICTED: uncharacterized protein LOC106745343 isoform X2 [Dinoponera quadriceps]XP_014476355.1 PREDICTED: uncharacterized protein LOC106745343 isoform X2 [Dinoponera quadriceps]XP_014476356.1 PREDICTED: uncharacterized protein LOC106745343 isoform X2 [Dinoponera quadriceps]
MVEFMYCGETTVSHQYLSSLLDAAKIFKVKELVSVIDTIVGTKRILDNLETTCLKQQTGDGSFKVANSSLTENDYVRVRCDKLSMENASLCAADNSNNDVCSIKGQSLESDAIDDTEHESEHTLYEEPELFDVGSDKVVAETPSFSMPEISVDWRSDANQVQTTGCARGNRDAITYCNNSHDLKPMLYEQCCDLSEVSDQTTTTSSSSSCCSTSRLPRVDDEHRLESSADVPFSKVGKCVKVYTHKRRKSADEMRHKLVHTQCNLVPTPPPSTDSIDLLDEPSDVPVTLLTSLDMESDEYILSLSTESIQSIVGSTISDQHTVIGCKKSNARPVLRRSTRLNQQESDEVAATEKPFKKGSSPNRAEPGCAKAKRKGREDRKVPDQHVELQSAVKRSLKNRRSSSKLIVRKSGKAVEESRTTSGGVRSEDAEGYARTVFRSPVSPVKFDTIGGIDRALWGDRSDKLSDEENNETTDSLVYSPNNAIPFAVGLLPLRTALEKMQATPDYQPRKTRSSFAAPSSRQDASALKRKANCAFPDIARKQQGSVGNAAESPKTVCHIQIKAAPSQDVKSRRSRLLGDGRREQAITQVS